MLITLSQDILAIRLYGARTCPYLRVVVRASAGRDNVLILHFSDLWLVPFWLIIRVIMPLATTQVRNDRDRQLNRCVQAIMRDIPVLLRILTAIPALRADLEWRPVVHVPILVSWPTL